MRMNIIRKSPLSSIVERTYLRDGPLSSKFIRTKRNDKSLFANSRWFSSSLTHSNFTKENSSFHFKKSISMKRHFASFVEGDDTDDKPRSTKINFSNNSHSFSTSSSETDVST